MGFCKSLMKPTTKIRFTEPQIALVMRAYPNCNLDRLTEVSFEFDQAGKIIGCFGTTAETSITTMPVVGSHACTRRHAAYSQLDKVAQRYCNFETARGRRAGLHPKDKELHDDLAFVSNFSGGHDLGHVCDTRFLPNKRLRGLHPVPRTPS